MNGRRAIISPDSVPLKQDDQTQLAYHSQVRLLDSPRELAKRGFWIRPGLVDSVKTKTGKRSIASYVTHTILCTADEGMREP